MAATQIDIIGLGQYLERHIAGFSGLKAIDKFAGGQSNPTFRLSATSGEYVLRRKPPGNLLKSAHAVDREYRVMNALEESDVPVPKVFHLCADESVIGSMFFVMQYVDGRILWDQTLPEETRQTRAAMFDEMNRVLAAIHNIDLDAVGLTDFGNPGNYFERQLDRWTRQYRASETGPIEPMEQLIDWLRANLPVDDGRVALVHGDYRLDNLIFAPDAPEILAVVDWELATLGHPFADLAYQCMQWHMPNNPLARGLGNVDRAAVGIPGEDDYVAAYCRRTGIAEISEWTFYLCFSFFRLAAIVQGVKKRALDGNASNRNAMQIGEMTRPLAAKAIELLEKRA